MTGANMGPLGLGGGGKAAMMADGASEEAVNAFGPGPGNFLGGNGAEWRSRWLTEHSREWYCGSARKLSREIARPVQAGRLTSSHES